MNRQPVIGHDDALAAIDAIRSELAKRGRSAAIAVVDAHGELIAALRQDGVALSSMPLAINKAFTAARLRRPTQVCSASSFARAAPTLCSTAIRATSASAAAFRSRRTARS